MTITVSAADVTEAETYIKEYLDSAIPDGDYSDGAALRDLAIKAVAGVFALSRKEAQQITARQSFKSLLEIDTTDDPQAANDAADALASNWFATRRTGGYARVMGYATATTRVDLTVYKNTRFFKTGSLTFLLDNAGQDLAVDAASMVAIYDSTGAVTGYQFRIPLVGSGVGDAYNIAPGRFAYFDNFSPYVIQVETLETAQAGIAIETNDDLIARSQNLVTVRNLINARSCDATLKDQFPEITSLTVIGMGDWEMIRDRQREITNGLEIHTGGCQDIFVGLPLQETSFTGVVGSRFARPDGVINVFRDLTYADYNAEENPTGHKFTDPDATTGYTIAPGMLLRVGQGLTNGVRNYRIKEVYDTELIVSEHLPFPEATDTQTTPTPVYWTIGTVGPDYNNVVYAPTSLVHPHWVTTGETSQSVQHTGCITLPSGPIYRIKDVALDDPTDDDADPTDGLVHFNVRVNAAPETHAIPDNEYQVVVHNPVCINSSQCYTEIRVGTVADPSQYDNKSLKVTYDTLAGFDSVDYKVSNSWDRIAGASPLLRGYHSTYIYFSLEYAPLRTATTTIDEDAAIEALVGYINTFPPTEVIDMSSIANFFQRTYADVVSQVYPFTITYEVYIPDGRVILFTTDDAVTIPTDLTKLRAAQASPDDPVEGLLDPLEYGLSDSVMTYYGIRDRISVTPRS